MFITFITWLENVENQDFIKDKDGLPLIFYHGTNSNFSTFHPAYTRGQIGFHFGNQEQASSIHGENKPKYIFKVHLKIKNPLRLEDQGGWYGETVVNMVNQALGIKLNSSTSAEGIAKAIRIAGYDGIVYENRFEGEGDSYIALDPKQIHILEKIIQH